MDKFRIALVQMKPTLNKEENLKKICRFVNEACKNGAEIVCFPEMSLCGYCKDFEKIIRNKIPGDTTKKLLQIAKNKKITIIAGILEKEKDNLYITQIIAFKDGTLKKYRKTHLGENEKKFCTAGDEIPVFKIKSLNNEEISFGIAICYDLHFPEVISIMSSLGAEIVFAPFASPMDGDKRFRMWEKYMNARAYDNRVYLAACNFYGVGIWNPLGDTVKSYKKDDEKIIIYDLDLEKLKNIRNPKEEKMKNKFFLKDNRNELYKKYM